MLQEFAVDGHLLIAIKSLYCHPEVCVRINGKQSKSFHMSVGLRQGCVLSPLLFSIYMNWMGELSRTDKCATIGRCKSSRLIFTDNLALLASSKFGLQHSLNSFAVACDIAGMKISTSKIEVVCYYLSRNPVPCSLQVGGVSLKQVKKFKYLGVAFTSDGRQDEKLDVPSSKASVVMRALHHSVVLKSELLRNIKLSVFNSIFVPIFIYRHES